MSWTPQAREVLDRACDRYGGLERRVYLRLGSVPVTALQTIFRSAAVEWAEGERARAQ